MTASQTMTVLDAIDAAKMGQRCVIICPSHDDRNPSLVVAPGTSQPVIFTCHAGCTREDILDAAGISWQEVCGERDGVDALAPGVDNWTPAGNASHIYPYVDETNTLLYEVLRVPLGPNEKTFRQRKPDPARAGKHLWKLDGVRRVPYRLPQLLQAIKEGRDVHVAEGEKDVHALLKVIPEGDAATCNAMGAGQWDDAWSPWFAGARVHVYVDADPAGRAHGRHVRECLTAKGARVRLLEAPGHKDVGAHLAAGLPLSGMLETTPESQAEKARTGVDITLLLQREAKPIEFAVPGTLAMRDRLLVTGLEGHGKSSLLRQIAVCTAMGIHPFSGAEFEPRRVLYIDAENEPDQVKDSWADLVSVGARHGRVLEPRMLTVMEEWDNDDLDLLSSQGRAWMEERMWAYRPHLTVIGPLSNVVEDDLKGFSVVNQLAKVINASRRVCDSAFVMEHHAPQRGAGDKVREVRPYGSSKFLKWPEFAFAMVPTDEVGTYEWAMNRGPRVRGRYWPDALRTGTPGTMEWPFMECVAPPRLEKGRR